MATTTETAGSAPALDVAPKPWWRRLVFGVRLRILGWYVGLLTLAICGTLLVERSILLQRYDEEVEVNLRQEVEEIERLAVGRDPNTGEPFGTDVGAVFETFFGRNIPGRREAFLAIAPGRAP